eukprot:COSAG01_NODE_23202_length_824_cov_1.194483_1_plen_37_part_01
MTYLRKRLGGGVAQTKDVAMQRRRQPLVDLKRAAAVG